MSRYLIPKQRCREEIRVSNSRFIATAMPVHSVREAQAFIRRIRKEMPDATHHVYAYKIGFGASVMEGLSDDGEPSGTAGPPTMAVLRGTGLGDIALVITRYFGGTKLGTGGLVAAYQAAAKVVFDALETEEKVEKGRYEIRIPYPLLKPVRHLIATHDGLLENESFAEAVRLVFQIPRSSAGAFTESVSDLTSGRIVVRELPAG